MIKFSLITENQNQEIKKDSDGIYILPYEHPSGGFIKRLYDYEKVEDEEVENVEALLPMVKNGKQFFLRPNDHLYKQGSPDVVHNDELWEIKTIKGLSKGTGYNTVQDALKRTKKQSNKVILKLNSDISEKDAMRAIKGKFKSTERLEALYLVKGDNYKYFNRKDILEFSFS